MELTSKLVIKLGLQELVSNNLNFMIIKQHCSNRRRQAAYYFVFGTMIMSFNKVIADINEIIIIVVRKAVIKIEGTSFIINKFLIMGTVNFVIIATSFVSARLLETIINRVIKLVVVN